ncbi:MAG TPA: hypothetical protein VIN56_04135, partial [Candidatus Dormibacteraeota bacterium]
PRLPAVTKINPGRLCAATLLALSPVVAACGPTAPSTPPLTGESNRTAAQILADAETAMAATRSFRVDSQNTTKTGSDSFTLSFADNGDFAGTVHTLGVSADAVVVGGQVYIKGREFWARVYSGSGIEPAQLQVILGKIGQRFAHDPGDVLGLLPGSKQLLPADIPDCMSVHGKLSKGGTDTFAGQTVIVLNDDGSQPGGMPGRYLIADAAPHRLLHADSHGPQTPGAPPAVGKCPAGPQVTAAAVDTSRKTTFTFSSFDRVGPVTKPTDTVEIAAG